MGEVIFDGGTSGTAAPVCAGWAPLSLNEKLRPYSTNAEELEEDVLAPSDETELPAFHN